LERAIRIADRFIAFLSENKVLLDDESLNAVVLFDLVTEKFTRLRYPFSVLTHAALDSSGQRVAWATENQWARIFSSATGEPLTPPVFHSSPLAWIAWNSDDSKILMAGDSPEIRVWAPSTGQHLLAPLRLGTAAVSAANWSLDDRFIVARSDDNTARVWDAETGEAVTPALQHSSYVIAANLISNNRLITISQPGVIRTWDLTETKLPAEILTDYARLVSGRRLNAAGVMVALNPEELVQLCRSLRQRAPELF
jgi:WD40 repeat protein